jgi:hypothetical protein
MFKALIVFAAIVVLAFSAGLTRMRPSQMLFDQDHRANLALASSGQGSDNAGMQIFGVAGQVPESTGRTAVEPSGRLLYQQVEREDDRPAPALLVYCVLILIGSCVAIGLVRHSQRREFQ